MLWRSFFRRPAAVSRSAMVCCLRPKVAAGSRAEPAPGVAAEAAAFSGVGAVGVAGDAAVGGAGVVGDTAVGGGVEVDATAGADVVGTAEVAPAGAVGVVAGERFATAIAALSRSKHASRAV